MVKPSTNIVYIASDVRSGSTLLDQLLGTHPDIVSVGELYGLFEYINEIGHGSERNGECTCGQKVKDCSFWSEISRHFFKNEGYQLDKALTNVKLEKALTSEQLNSVLNDAEMTGKNRRPQRKLTHDQKTQIARNCWAVLKSVRDIFQPKWIIDSSKNAEQLNYLLKVKPEVNFKIIYLTRDGRGVTVSKKRRWGCSAFTGTYTWMRNNVRLLRVLKNVDARSIYQCKYEQIAGQPVPTLENICSFLELDFYEDITSNFRKNKHNIGGSPSKSNPDKTNIRLDVRWKKSLSIFEKAQFLIVAGWMNKKLNY